MNLYNNLCSKVKDIFLVMISKKKDFEVKEYRSSKEQSKSGILNEITKKNIELKKTLNKEQVESEKTKKSLPEQERQKTLSLFYHFDQTADIRENSYEFLEIKRNYSFFLAVKNDIFYKGEYGYSFLDCTFNESENQKYRGYLIVTASRLLFVSEDVSKIKKLHFTTITNVQWFNNGVLENRLTIQYGNHYLDFDKSSDFEQMKKAGSFIQNFSHLNI